jgi:hypothetical protein
MAKTIIQLDDISKMTLTELIANSHHGFYTEIGFLDQRNYSFLLNFLCQPLQKKWTNFLKKSIL